MKVLYAVLSFVLAAVLIAIPISLVNSIKDELIIDTSVTDSSPSFNIPAVTDSNVVVEPDSTDEYALKLGEGSLNRMVCVNNGQISRFGFLVEGLDVTVPYYVEWSIDESFSLETKADFINKTVNGVIQPCVIWTPNYTGGEFGGIIDGQGTYSEALNGNTYITISKSDSDSILWFFEASYVSIADDKLLSEVLYESFNSLTFIEAKG